MVELNDVSASLHLSLFCKEIGFIWGILGFIGWYPYDYCQSVAWKLIEKFAFNLVKKGTTELAIIATIGTKIVKKSLKEKHWSNAENFMSPVLR